MFQPKRSDWHRLVRPQSTDNALQAALREYLICHTSSSLSSSRQSSSIKWEHIDHPTWAGTPSYIPSSIKPVSIEKVARRHRPRARPVPSAASCMSVSHNGDFLAVAYTLPKMVNYYVGPHNSKRQTQNDAALGTAWRLLLVGVFDVRARNVPVRWLVAGDVDSVTGVPCEFERACDIAITNLAWSSDGSVLYGGTNSGTLYGWNVVASKLEVFHQFSEDSDLNWSSVPQWVSIKDIATHPHNPSKTLISVDSSIKKSQLFECSIVRLGEGRASGGGSNSSNGSHWSSMQVNTRYAVSGNYGIRGVYSPDGTRIVTLTSQHVQLHDSTLFNATPQCPTSSTELRGADTLLVQTATTSVGKRPMFLQILQQSGSSSSLLSSFQVLVAMSGAVQMVDGEKLTKIGSVMYDTVGRSTFDAAASSCDGQTIVGSTFF